MPFRLYRAVVRYFLFLLLLVLVNANPAPAEAKTRLFTMDEGTRVYSGPGKYYRRLVVLKARTEVRAANETVKTRDGEFYRVLVFLSPKQKAIGFIPVSANVRKLSEDVTDDDLEKFGAVALVSRAAQFSYTRMHDDQSMWSTGYMHYVTPGFYVKGFVGQLLKSNAYGAFGGGEIGNDSLLYGRFSGVVSYAAGALIAKRSNAIFDGSKNLSAMMQAFIGARYNLTKGSITTGLTQAVFFNANNSLVASGITVAFEVGL